MTVQSAVEKALVEAVVVHGRIDLGGRELFDSDAMDAMRLLQRIVPQTISSSSSSSLLSSSSLTLDCSQNYICPDGCRAIAQTVSSFSSHNDMTLDLENNLAGSQGAVYLADICLSTTTTTTTNKCQSRLLRLRHLRLGSNMIGVQGAMAIANALATNHTLTSLDLGVNKIGNLGAQALAHALSTNHTLQELHLERNMIGNTGFLAIMKALDTNHGSNLTTLSLARNLINDNGMRGLHHIWNDDDKTHGGCLSCLDLGFNLLSGHGLQFLADAVQSNHQLESVRVTGPNVAAKNHPAYHRLRFYLYRNRIQDKIRDMLVDVDDNSKGASVASQWAFVLSSLLLLQQRKQQPGYGLDVAYCLIRNQPSLFQNLPRTTATTTTTTTRQ